MKATIRLKHFFYAFLALTTFVMTSCVADDPVAPVVKEYGKAMLFHGAPNAPTVDLFVDNTKQTTASLAYGSNSGYIQVEAGATNKKIQTKTSAGVSIDSSSYKINKDVGYSFFAYVDAAKAVKVLPKSDDLTAPPATKAKVRVVHLIADIGGTGIVDFEAAEVSKPASARNDQTSIKFTDATQFVEMEPGKKDLKFKTAGTSNLLLLNTDNLNGFEFKAGKIYTLVIHGSNAKVNTDPLGMRMTVINNN
jgi:hypothetical protein